MSSKAYNDYYSFIACLMCTSLEDYKARYVNDSDLARNAYTINY